MGTDEQVSTTDDTDDTDEEQSRREWRKLPRIELAIIRAFRVESGLHPCNPCNPWLKTICDPRFPRDLRDGFYGLPGYGQLTTRYRFSFVPYQV